MISKLNDFKTKIDKNDIYINYLNKYLNVPNEIVDIDYSDANVSINYTIDIESKDWGVKGIYVNIDKVVIDIDWEACIEDLKNFEKDMLIKVGGYECSKDYFCGNILIDLEKEKEWKVECEAEFTSGGFSIDYADIDFANKLITIR